MNLYATVTSERATKGQGGNKYIEIELTVGSTNQQKKAGIVLMEPSDYGFEVRYIPPAGISKADSILLSEIKGERQKGEIETWCNGKHKTEKELFECSDCKRFF